MFMVRPSLAYCALFLFSGALDTRLFGQAQKYEGLPITNIRFNPPEQPVDPEELHEILPVKMNQPFRMAEVRAAIERVFATGHYADIQVDAQPYRDGVAITFLTKNNWFIGAVAVTGQIGIPPNKGQLENAADLGLGQPYTDDKVENGMGEMKRLLENNGLFLSQFEPVFDWETNKDYQQVNLRFEVASGKRAKFAQPMLTGDLKMDQKRVENATKLRRWLIHTWKPITQTRVRQALDGVRSLYLKEDRLEAKVTLETVRYHPDTNSASPVLQIDAGPRIEVRTIGAKLSRKTLQRHIPVFEEHAVDHDLLVEGGRNLRDYFQSKGYFEAEVQFKEQSVVNDKSTIDYLVNTGERHRLVRIEISGNRYFNTETIRERMFLQTASLLQYRRGRFSGNLLRRDEESIRNLYSSNGFRDVVVTHRLEDDYRGRIGDLAVLIDIVEGSQYFVHDLRIEGIEKLDRERLVGMLSSAKGQPFSEFNVAVDRDTILNEYFKTGFPDASFEWDAEPAAEPHQMDLRFVVKEGRQQFVRAVLTSGNRVTRTRLINRQITLSPGDPLSPTEMTDIQRRLYGLGVFAKVNTAIQNPDGATSRKYVLYNMEETRRYSTALGFGAELGRIGGCRNNCATYTAAAGATGFSPRVSFDITRSNLWGLAHSISLRTRLSTLNKRALLNYSWPRFASSENLSAAISLMYQYSNDIRTFTFKRQEASAQLVQKLDKARTLFYRFTYRRNGISNLQVTDFLVPQLARPVRVGIPSITLIEDKRDDAVEPRKGIYNTLDFGVADRIFGSQVNFLRLLVRNATYHPVSKRLTLARSTQFGNIYGFNYGANESDIPLAERFYGGGGTSHRGFPENQAGPRDEVTGFPLGGTALLFNQVELRFPLLGDNIGGVLFHDAGNIYSSLSNLSFRAQQRDLKDFDYMVQAAGFGLRYRTPIGPVRVDVAYSINPPSFFGFMGTQQELIEAGVTPCSPPAGMINRCVQQSVGHFNFFFSIGQTF